MGKVVRVFGGGTFADIASHLAVCSPAFGGTAGKLTKMMRHSGMNAFCHLTKMACPGSSMRTNQDVADVVNGFLTDESLGAIVMNVAFCDYEPMAYSYVDEFGDEHLADIEDDPAHSYRIHKGKYLHIPFQKTEKVISSIKKKRPDVFLVSFKTTCNDSKQNQLEKGRELMKSSGSDLVLCNDVGTRENILILNQNEYTHSKRDTLLKNMVVRIRQHLIDN